MIGSSANPSRSGKGASNRKKRYPLPRPSPPFPPQCYRLGQREDVGVGFLVQGLHMQDISSWLYVISVYFVSSWKMKKLRTLKSKLGCAVDSHVTFLVTLALSHGC